MRVLVVGGFQVDDPQADDIRIFCQALGKAVVDHGHVLLNGASNELDRIIAEAANEALQERGSEDIDKRIISYVPVGKKPIHYYGSVLGSRFESWELHSAIYNMPEQVDQADVVILVKGFDGTSRAAAWAHFARKPRLPFASFGGAAATIYQLELDEFNDNYGGRLERRDFEQLNAINENWVDRASKTIVLAEKVMRPRSVLAVMSYTDRSELKDAYGTFRRVCGDLDYVCERITEQNATTTQIYSEILERIRRAAFIIVDLTELKPNVFLELGYARGIGKKVIVTAMNGTEPPFDVKDTPIIFWDSQEDLGRDLRDRIQLILESAVLM